MSVYRHLLLHALCHLPGIDTELLAFETHRLGNVHTTNRLTAIRQISSNAHYVVGSLSDTGGSKYEIKILTLT